MSVVGLQGGAEFGAACKQMDLATVRAAKPGPIIVIAAAASPGAGYAAATANAVRYYRKLVGEHPHGAADPRDDVAQTIAAVDQAAMLVLPGGSPSGLRDVLIDGDRTTELGALIVDRWRDDGLVVSGASAGAMVLGTHCWLPDRGGTILAGLGLFDGFARPHHSGETVDRPDGLDDAVTRWGLPECGGGILDGPSATAVGAGTPLAVIGGRTVAIPREATPVADL